MISIAALLLPSTVALGGGSKWTRVGPRNIFDDEHMRGQAGTLATAASPASNPNLIYSGGKNNGASSGVLKSTDLGLHWTQTSNGLFDTRVQGLFIHPDDNTGNHVLASTPSGLYETTNGAASWSLVPSWTYGNAQSFRACVIAGVDHICVVTGAGIANIPVHTPDDAHATQWTVIKYPAGRSDYVWNTPLSITQNYAKTKTTVVTGCDGGGKTIWIGTITSPTVATWTSVAAPCFSVAVDPNDAMHFLYTNASAVATIRAWETTDGFKTSHPTTQLSGAFYVAIDTHGWLYTIGESGAFVSSDKGATWKAYITEMESPEDGPHSRIPEDYQRIVLDFAGDGVAFPSDQGLYIKPKYPSKDLKLVAATGDMSNNIAIHVAVSKGEVGSGKPNERSLVTTVWDWNVIASWDSGDRWPATPCAFWNPDVVHPINNCTGAPVYIGEGGAAYSFGTSNIVIILHYNNIAIDASMGGKNFTRIVLPNNANDHSSVLVYKRDAKKGRAEPNGFFATVCTMDVTANGTAPGASVAMLSDTPSPDPHDRDGGETDAFLETMSFGEVRDQDPDHPWDTSALAGKAKFLLKSSNFGQKWTWIKLPSNVENTNVLAVDPTDASVLYAIAANCLASSKDEGVTWSKCSTSKGLTGTFASLIVKDSTTMIMLRLGDIPLRTVDGGKHWSPLVSVAKLKTYKMSGSYSWSGKTLVLHGKDISAPSRGEYAGFVWTSTDDGTTWSDETGDMVTMAVNAGTWYEEDFYLTTSGEGILLKEKLGA